MKRFARIVPIIGSVFVLFGCQTWSDIKADFNDINWSFANSEPSIYQDPQDMACPSVTIVDELSSLTEFEGFNGAQTEDLTSQVFMTKVSSGCNHNERNVTVDLKLEFKGMLGPGAKVQDNDKPFFSYPFFIAVLNEKDEILAKEVFSASLTYARNEDTHTYYESMRQIIPIESGRPGGHKVLVGFQLTQDQLAYNRQNMIPVAPITQKPATVNPGF